MVVVQGDVFPRFSVALQKQQQQKQQQQSRGKYQLFIMLLISPLDQHQDQS